MADNSAVKAAILLETNTTADADLLDEDLYSNAANATLNSSFPDADERASPLAEQLPLSLNRDNLLLFQRREGELPLRADMVSRSFIEMHQTPADGRDHSIRTNFPPPSDMASKVASWSRMDNMMDQTSASSPDWARGTSSAAHGAPHFEPHTTEEEGSHSHINTSAVVEHELSRDVLHSHLINMKSGQKLPLRGDMIPLPTQGKQRHLTRNVSLDTEPRSEAEPTHSATEAEDVQVGEVAADAVAASEDVNEEPWSIAPTADHSRVFGSHYDTSLLLLNSENLLHLRQQLAAGEVPLRPELLMEITDAFRAFAEGKSERSASMEVAEDVSRIEASCAQSSSAAGWCQHAHVRHADGATTTGCESEGSPAGGSIHSTLVEVPHNNSATHNNSNAHHHHHLDYDSVSSSSRSTSKTSISEVTADDDESSAPAPPAAIGSDRLSYTTKNILNSGISADPLSRPQKHGRSLENRDDARGAFLAQLRTCEEDVQKHCARTSQDVEALRTSIEASLHRLIDDVAQRLAGLHMPHQGGLPRDELLLCVSTTFGDEDDDGAEDVRTPTRRTRSFALVVPSSITIRACKELFWAKLERQGLLPSSTHTLADYVFTWKDAVLFDEDGVGSLGLSGSGEDGSVPLSFVLLRQ